VTTAPRRASLDPRLDFDSALGEFLDRHQRIRHLPVTTEGGFLVLGQRDVVPGHRRIVVLLIRPPLKIGWNNPARGPDDRVPGQEVESELLTVPSEPVRLIVG